jgi:hypothetical protein
LGVEPLFEAMGRTHNNLALQAGADGIIHKKRCTRSTSTTLKPPNGCVFTVHYQILMRWNFRTTHSRQLATRVNITQENIKNKKNFYYQTHHNCFAIQASFFIGSCQLRGHFPIVEKAKSHETFMSFVD